MGVAARFSDLRLEGGDATGLPRQLAGPHRDPLRRLLDVSASARGRACRRWEDRVMIKLSPLEIFRVTVDLPQQLARLSKHRLVQVCTSESLQLWRCSDTTSTSHGFEVLSLP